MSREDSRQLARGFAAHLRHLREFRGLRYVGARDTPRPARAATEDTVPPPIADLSVDAIPPPRSSTPTWPERQAEPAGVTPPSAPSARRSDPTIHKEITQPSPTWPLEQVDDPRRAPAPPAAVHLPVAADGGVRDQARAWSAAEKLDYLRRKNLGNCTRCKLAQGRKHIVFGVGDAEADLMFIGEAPGYDEDRTGEPFVGAAGKRLTDWIGRLGLTRDQVYIANVLKCRPPNNRDPDADEVEKCSPFLRAQIRAIQPKVIVALGRYAGMLMTGCAPDTTLRSMRSRSWPYRDPSGHEASLFVTYHPSYVIRQERELAPGQRNPADDTVMADLQQALSKLRKA